MRGKKRIRSHTCEPERFEGTFRAGTVRCTVVQLVISDDHESIKAAIQVELPSARWQRCIAHFQRNVLCHVPALSMAEVAADLSGIFAVHRQETAAELAKEFVKRHGKSFSKAVEVLSNGLTDALTFLAFPSSHHRLLRTTNGLERLFGEVKRRTRVIGVFPSEKSAANLCTAVVLRATEEWALKRYLDMEPLAAMNRQVEGE